MARQRSTRTPARVNGSSDPERSRLKEARNSPAGWRLWGPYLSERQWGTVREDYSPDGSAWDYFPHDQARRRAYRWGEDGIAGISDDHQYLCFSVALWNGKDPILKERLFGLTGSEGNHGEDVKELYYYLDSTPTHSYMRMLYKYPQREYPYAKLVEENRRRGKANPEFEIVDSGLFDDDRYFDVFVEYAKAGPTDLLIEISVHNRGPEVAGLELLPQLWFRNTWSWSAAQVRPEIHLGADGGLVLSHETLENYHAYVDGKAEAIFCDNDTNVSRVFGAPSAPGYFKDAFHEYIVHGSQSAVNPHKTGTKAAFRFPLTVAARGSEKVRLRLSAKAQSKPFIEFNRLMSTRKSEADAFYAPLQAHLIDPEVRAVQRQAWAGMLWSKQYYHLNVNQWLSGDPNQPAPPRQRFTGRNSDWPHLHNSDVISMPDKWEYPWYAAWDLAFHSIPLAMIDAEFAKEQLVLLTREWYMHPNGQLPAYEWGFGDVNPPVHAWAAWRVYCIDQAQNGGKGDLAFLERIFHKLLLNFTWWVNRKDVHGRNIFQGGFLGLDNIGVFDRSAALPTGGFISQCDGTAWMAMYSLNLMRIAVELSTANPVYQDSATKFFEHFLYIAEALTNLGGRGIDLWDGGDEFYYDVLCLPDGHSLPLKVRSMVGLIPLFAVEVLDSEFLAKVPQFRSRLEWFLKHRPKLASLVSRWEVARHGETRLLSLLRGHRMKRLLKRMLDETEFLSDYGVRAISRYHRDAPYVFSTGGQDFTVRYTPGESDTYLFGGNSNWRGPVWFPVNYLLVESIRRFHNYYGDDFKVECPTGSGNLMTLHEVADELANRLTRIFLPDKNGKRPVFNHHPKLQADPHFRDHLLFYEYFHGDCGRGVGASHQTGWTGLIAALIAPHDHPHPKSTAVTAARTAASKVPTAI
jgi:hypothetical protein